jgi:phosphate transport system permease protein
MDTLTSSAAADTLAAQRRARMAARLTRRHAGDRLFKLAGLAAVAFSALVLVFLLVSMASSGLAGFQRSELRFDLPCAASFQSTATAWPSPTRPARSNSPACPRWSMPLPKRAWARAAPRCWPMAPGATWPRASRKSLPCSMKPVWRFRCPRPTNWPPRNAAMGRRSAPGGAATGGARQAGARVRLGLPRPLRRHQPAGGGHLGALKGSIMTMLVTLVLAFPVGVLAALYLEEYAPRNRWTDLIEISINNLAAVPSIIFGLLGLAVFLAIFPHYRSAPLIGGMTLALMTMPVIVISGRNAIKAVPPSIRDAALAMGASPVQVVFHHVLPLALPGILTGTIIGMARALGETAPLLMIGMRAFVASPPGDLTSPSTVLPVQIFLWSDEIDRGFIERTSAAIVVLLIFLLLMNGLAIYLRNRFEKRW